VRQKYLPGYVVAQHLCITGHLLSRITGTIFVNRVHKDRDGGKVNIALNLKFNKTNKEVVAAFVLILLRKLIIVFTAC
jgi:hypothetical protein